MPTRPYSMRILGGSWPSTSPESWSDTASALSKKSADLSMSAAAIRRAADDLGGGLTASVALALHVRRQQSFALMTASHTLTLKPTEQSDFFQNSSSIFRD